MTVNEVLRKHGLPTDGLGGELAHDAVVDAQAGMRGWRGVLPATVGGAESVQVLGGGTQTLVTFDTPAGPIQVAISPEDATGLGARLLDLNRSILVRP